MQIVLQQPVIRFSATSAKSNGSDDSLYLYVKFADEAAKTEALRHDVSVGLSPQFIDGRGVVYSPAMVHLAATAKPVVPGLAKWEQVADDPSGLTFVKESLPASDYYKQSENFSLGVDQKYLAALAENIDRMIENCAPVPFQMSHDGDGHKLGDVVGCEIKKRSKQLPPVSMSQFNPRLARAPQLVKLSQVNGVSTVNIEELAALLGVELTPDMDEVGKIAAVKARLDSLMACEAGSKAGEGADAGAVPNEAGANMAATPGEGNAAAAGMTTAAAAAAPTAGNAAPSSITVKFSANSVPEHLVALTKRARQAELSGLVASGRMTPAEKTIAEKAYVTDEAARNSVMFSQNQIADPYDTYIKGIETRENNSAWSADGRNALTDAQAREIRLSNNAQASGLSPLQANRERRNKDRADYLKR